MFGEGVLGGRWVCYLLLCFVCCLLTLDVYLLFTFALVCCVYSGLIFDLHFVDLCCGFEYFYLIGVNMVGLFDAGLLLLDTCVWCLVRVCCGCFWVCLLCFVVLLTVVSGFWGLFWGGCCFCGF